MVYRTPFLTYIKCHTSIIPRHTLLEKRFLPGYWSIKLIINVLFVLVISLYRQEISICLGDICTIRGERLFMVKQVRNVSLLFISFASKLWFTMTTVSFPAKPSPHQCSPGSLQTFVNSWGMSSPALSSVAIKLYKFI